MRKIDETKIKYYHIRNYDIYGRPSNKGGLTIAIFNNNVKYLVGIAICSVLDNFCKKTGRDLTSRRLLLAKHNYAVYSGDTDILDYCGHFAQYPFTWKKDRIINSITAKVRDHGNYFNCKTKSLL